MYPILTLRSEFVCLVILVFLFFTSRAYNVNSESRVFTRIINFAIVHIVFDIITVLTVNHLDTVPSWLNWICHVMFYLSAILYSNELFTYVVAIVYPSKIKKFYCAGHLLTAVYLVCLSFLKIEYVADLGTNSSAGPAAIVGYGLAFLFFISALAIIFTHLKKMPASFKSALIPMMLVLMITEVSQVIWRSILFTGGAITIVTVGFFFSLENPVAVFKQKAMLDALTGVMSRRSYEEDIEKLNQRFIARPGNEHTFVFCDINDLRNVNNQFGHAEGDNYITLIASSIKKYLLHAASVYRIGGDEFLIYYNNVEEQTVEKEIKELQDACEKASEDLKYTAGVAAGYAVSSDNYKNLFDVVKTADYAMYQNKALIKSGNGSDISLGTKLNYSGLTDRMFEAMCASNDRNYPFLTNMDTNVTRIAPGWKEYFGLDSEFYEDFASMWQQYIHPDDFEGYMEDIVAVINGHKRYHNYDYLAKRPDGEYVKISCHGSMYRDSTSGIAYFSGFVENHGMDDHTDFVSQLKNYEILNSRVHQFMDEGKAFSILKLKLINFARVNMLYGYGGGNEVIKGIAKILSRELGDGGQVFCQSSVNFSVFFNCCDKDYIRDYYRRICEICSAGLETEIGSVPVQFAGGAVTNNGSKASVKKIRSVLVYTVEESQFYQRNNLVFYDENGDENEDSDIPLLTQIHIDALSDMQFFKLRYQPIIDLESKKTVGAEALLRWIHPSFGEIAPGIFIEFIENDPCYYRLGLNILEQAVRDAKKFKERNAEFRINVNITALQLQNESFADNVFEILDKYDYNPNGLVLELTERCKEMDSTFLSRKIAELRSRGLLVAFDDLGTGYSSIKLLMDIPVDEIKLDKDFVSEIGVRQSYQIFVQSLVLGGKALNGYTICFEGIEDEETLAVVSKFGNFLAQGYYFAKPLLIDEFTEYINKE